MALLVFAVVVAQQLFTCVAAGGLVYISYLLVVRRDTGWQLVAIGWGTAWAIVTSYDLVRLICWYRAFTTIACMYPYDETPRSVAIYDGVLTTLGFVAGRAFVRRAARVLQPNQALQLTRAAEPGGQREAAGSGPRS